MKSSEIAKAINERYLNKVDAFLLCRLFPLVLMSCGSLSHLLLILGPWWRVSLGPELLTRVHREPLGGTPTEAHTEPTWSEHFSWKRLLG